MADFKYNKKVRTKITQGPNKGQYYMRYFYGPRPGTVAGMVAARRVTTIAKMEVQRDKLMVDYNKTGSKWTARKLRSINAKIAQLNEFTRQGVF
jgi:hypothetical protein